MSEIIEEEDIQVIYADEEDSEVFKFVSDLSADDWEGDPFTKSVKKQRGMSGLSSGMKRKMTNEINKHIGTGGAKSKSRDREQLNGYDFYEVVPPLYNLDHLALLMEKSSIHAAAVAAKVNSSVSVGFDVNESDEVLSRLEQADFEGDQKTIDFLRRKVARIEKRISRWLDDVNVDDTFVEILEKWVTDYEAMGVGYLEIGRKSNGGIGYIGHIPAHTIRPRKDRDGYVQIVDADVTFFRNFGDLETSDPIGGDPSPNEILPLRKYTPRSTYYGVPDIVPALVSVAGVEFAKQYNLEYFENKAIPKHLIIVKGGRLGKAAERRLIQFFQNNVKGKHHRAVYIPLPELSGGGTAELSIEPVESDIQDASFEKYINMGRDEILMAHRVPLSKVGLSSDINLAAARDLDRNFKEAVINPLQNKIEKRINYILSAKTDIVSVSLKKLSLVDEDTQSKIDETNLRNGVTNVNEVRTSRGQKAIEGGDEYVNYVLETSRIQAESKSEMTQGRQREKTESRDGPDGNSNVGREPKS